ncbi:hypothetical protein KDJ56_16615 [Brevibacillus composti]|uniref:Uncharacterized protein n=1 Tax=Brevibacillus composti TaxID=2796470 RepID=A0A7T5EJ30_9BACL|nr:hypothetical protein [Brevibacillus composti]QQE73510.1 hypothetical protein JD108_16670 [Brevibacillus composti]QUO40592.1 hypothetical protein KDJ56_16615 [Brevibacillus composti]
MVIRRKQHVLIMLVVWIVGPFAAIAADKPNPNMLRADERDHIRGGGGGAGVAPHEIQNFQVLYSRYAAAGWDGKVPGGSGSAGPSGDKSGPCDDSGRPSGQCLARRTCGSGHAGQRRMAERCCQDRNESRAGPIGRSSPRRGQCRIGDRPRREKQQVPTGNDEPPPPSRKECHFTGKPSRRQSDEFFTGGWKQDQFGSASSRPSGPGDGGHEEKRAVSFAGQDGGSRIVSKGQVRR